MKAPLFLPLMAIGLSACAAAGVAGEVEGEACPGVTVLSGDDVEVADATLTFPRAGHDDILALAPGHILVSAKGDGLLREIVSIADEGDKIVVATIPADLAATECEGDVDGAFNTGGGGEDGGDSADFLGATFSAGKFSLVADTSTRAFIDVEPWASMATDFQLTGKLGRSAWARAAFKICPSGGIRVNTNIAGLYSGSVFKSIHEQSFTPWTFLVPTPLAVPIPVVIVPSVGVGVGLVASTYGPVAYDAEYQFGGCVEFAAHWEIGAALPRFETKNEFKVWQVNSNLTANNDFTIRAFLNTPDMKLCLYGTLCVALAAQSYVEVIGKGATGEHAVCAGLRLHPRFTARVPLFSGPIGSASVNYSAGPPLQLIREKIAGDGVCDAPTMDISPVEVPPPPDRRK